MMRLISSGGAVFVASILALITVQAEPVCGE
jgi:hypothetical protein